MYYGEYGTTHGAERTRRQFETFKSKHKLDENHVGWYSVWLYRWQLFIAIPLNLWLLVDNIAFDASAGTGDVLFSAACVAIAIALGRFYLRPRHQLAQLKKKRNELRENNELVALETDFMFLLKERCRTAGLSTGDADKLLEEFPDLAVKIARAQVDISEAKKEGLGQLVNGIEASLKRSIDDVTKPVGEARKAGATLQRNSLEDRLQLEYEI